MFNLTMQLLRVYEEHLVIVRLIGSVAQVLNKVKHVCFMGESLIDGVLLRSLNGYGQLKKLGVINSGIKYELPLRSN